NAAFAILPHCHVCCVDAVLDTCSLHLCQLQAAAGVPHHDAQAPVHRPAAQRPHVHHLQELHHPGAARPPLRQKQHGPGGERGRSCILILDDTITEKDNSSTQKCAIGRVITI
ncbi:hypothetical protein CDAR_199171, partial [Caerostris darwini]